MKMEIKKNQLEKTVCPFKTYCVAPLQDREVCEGKKGNQTECGTYQHYIEQDYKMHHPQPAQITI